MSCVKVFSVLSGLLSNNNFGWWINVFVSVICCFCLLESVVGYFFVWFFSFIVVNVWCVVLCYWFLRFNLMLLIIDFYGSRCVFWNIICVFFWILVSGVVFVNILFVVGVFRFVSRCSRVFLLLLLWFIIVINWFVGICKFSWFRMIFFV